MSATQSNIELNNNNRMNENIKTVEHIFGYVLFYTIIIFTTLSAILGGIIVSPIFAAIYIFNKVKANCFKEEKELKKEENTDKKMIIDENWCNVSVNNIINYQRKRAEVNLKDESDSDEEYVISEADLESDVKDVISEADLESDVKHVISEAVLESENTSHISANLEEEILSLKMPEEYDEEEEEDSPNDKYSLRYKSYQEELTN